MGGSPDQESVTAATSRQAWLEVRVLPPFTQSLSLPLKHSLTRRLAMYAPVSFNKRPLPLVGLRGEVLSCSPQFLGLLSSH